MSTRADIEAWVKLGESETLEFKATTGERRQAAQTVCAVLDHCGGRIGVAFHFSEAPSETARFS